MNQTIKKDDIISMLHTKFAYDIPVDNLSSISELSGWKLSIQGTNLDDAKYLVSKLSDFLQQKGIPFKVATQRRFDLLTQTTTPEEENRLREQGHKAMTIYCTHGVDVIELAKKVSEMISDYTGGNEVKQPTSYTQFSECKTKSIYFRNDRDENGDYVRPN